MLLRRKSQGASIAIVALLTLLACSSGSDSKLGLVAKNRGNSDQELERLRKMQLVRVIERDEATGKLEFHEKSPERVEADLIDQCAQEINDTTKFDEFDPLCPALTTAGCSERACAASLAGCAAHLALEIASIRAAPVSIDFHIDRNPDPDNPDPSLVEDAHYQIPPQSSATNAALAKMAMELARNAMAHGSDALRSVFDPGVDCQSADLSQPVLDGRTIGSILSTTYAEAFNTYREATLKAVDFNLAVADSQRTDTSLERGVGRSVAGAELSRVAAAHLAVGGPAGLAGTMDGAPRAGLCSAPELSGLAQQALSALRESGVSPAAILAIPGQAPSGVTAIPIGTLLNGTAKQIAGGSVRQRLSEIWGYDFDHPPAGVPASQTVPQYLRLQDQDFVEARNYLAQEIIAFSRSSVAQTRPARAAGAKPSGACATMANPNAFCDSYVATAQPPSDRPDAYWSAIVRDHGARLGDVIGTAPILGDQTDFADTIDAALTFAGLLLQNETNLDT